MGKLTLRIQIEKNPTTNPRYFRLHEQVYILLSLWRDGSPVRPGQYDPGSVVGYVVGRTPDLDALDVSYSPWIIPTERRMRVVFKTASVAVRLVCALSEYGTGERAQRSTAVTVRK